MAPAPTTVKSELIPISVEALQKRLDNLNDLEKQFNSAAKLSRTLFSSSSHEIHRAFEVLGSLSTALRSEDVQKAIRASEESDRAAPLTEEPIITKLDTVARVQKPPTRSPVQPHRPKNGLQLLPPRDSPVAPPSSDRSATFSSLPLFKRITLSNISQFIQTANQVRPKTLKIQIWLTPRARVHARHVYSQSKSLDIISVIRQSPTYRREPLILRVKVADVSVVYIRLCPVMSDEAPLRAMSVNCVSLSEKKLPHEPSNYIVYHQMSQFFTTLLAEHYDRFSIPLMLDLLSTYDTLFTDVCVMCGALLSRSGRFPPVGRIWKDDGLMEDQRAQWRPCHIQCIH